MARKGSKAELGAAKLPEVTAAELGAFARSAYAYEDAGQALVVKVLISDMATAHDSSSTLTIS